jgi:hypothetical protein
LPSSLKRNCLSLFSDHKFGERFDSPPVVRQVRQIQHGCLGTDEKVRQQPSPVKKQKENAGTLASPAVMKSPLAPRQDFGAAGEVF